MDFCGFCGNLWKVLNLFVENFLWKKINKKKWINTVNTVETQATPVLVTLSARINPIQVVDYPFCPLTPLMGPLAPGLAEILMLRVTKLTLNH